MPPPQLHRDRHQSARSLRWQEKHAGGGAYIRSMFMLASLAEVTIRRRPWAVTLFSSSSIGTYDEQKPQQHHQQKVAAAEREEGREEGREHHHHTKQPATSSSSSTTTVLRSLSSHSGRRGALHRQVV